MSLPREGLRGLAALLALAHSGSALADEPAAAAAAEQPAPAAAPTAPPVAEPVVAPVPVAAPVVAPAPVAAPVVAPVAPSPAVESMPPTSQRTWRAAVRLEYGTLRKPSDCPNYCDDAYGPALSLSAGWMMSPQLAVVLEGWLFERDALAVLAGAQYWLGEEDGWVRASVGVMNTRHHNADGGPGGGTGPALNLGAGVRLSRFNNFSTELAVRFAVVTHDVGTVSAFTLGYGLAW